MPRHRRGSRVRRRYRRGGGGDPSGHANRGAIVERGRPHGRREAARRCGRVQDVHLLQHDRHGCGFGVPVLRRARIPAGRGAAGSGFQIWGCPGGNLCAPARRETGRGPRLLGEEGRRSAAASGVPGGRGGWRRLVDPALGHGARRGGHRQAQRTCPPHWSYPVVAGDGRQRRRRLQVAARIRVDGQRDCQRTQRPRRGHEGDGRFHFIDACRRRRRESRDHRRVGGGNRPGHPRRAVPPLRFRCGGATAIPPGRGQSVPGHRSGGVHQLPRRRAGKRAQPGHRTRLHANRAGVPRHPGDAGIGRDGVVVGRGRRLLPCGRCDVRSRCGGPGRGGGGGRGSAHPSCGDGEGRRPLQRCCGPDPQ